MEVGDGGSCQAGLGAAQLIPKQPSGGDTPRLMEPVPLGPEDQRARRPLHRGAQSGWDPRPETREGPPAHVVDLGLPTQEALPGGCDGPGGGPGPPAQPAPHGSRGAGPHPGRSLLAEVTPTS